MGFFSKKRPEVEKRESILGEGDTLDLALRAALCESTVTAEQAMQIPAVAGCIGLISGLIAGLPVKLYRETDGKVEEIQNDSRLRLLNEETGDLLDAVQWKTAMIRDYFLRGGGYSVVDCPHGRAEGLYYVEPGYVNYEKSPDSVFKKAWFWVNGMPYPEFRMLRLLRNSRDGVMGRSVVLEHGRLFEIAYKTQTYELKMVTGGTKRGFLKSQKHLTKEALDALRNGWQKLYSGDDTTVVLNDGVEFQDAGQTAVEAQLNEGKEENAKEICKLFGVTPTLLTGGATAQDRTDTIQNAVLPVLNALQQALNRYLLLEAEKKEYYFAFDTYDLLKGDLLSRYQAYEIATRNGFMQIDEVRYREDLNPLGLRFVKLGLDTVLYDPENQTIYTPNTNETNALNSGGRGNPAPTQNPET